MADRLLLLADEEQLTGIRRQMEELAALVKGNKQALNLNGILAEASAKFNDPYLRKSSNWQEFIPFIEEFVRNLKGLAKDLETPVNVLEKGSCGMRLFMANSLCRKNSDCGFRFSETGED